MTDPAGPDEPRPPAAPRAPEPAPPPTPSAAPRAPEPAPPPTPPAPTPPAPQQPSPAPGTEPAPEASQHDTVAFGWPPPPTPGVDEVWSTGGAARAPRRAPGWGAVIGIALVTALLAGLVGGFVGVVAERRSGSVYDPNASLGTVPTTSPSRPADSVAGIAGAVLPTVVSLTVEGVQGSGTGSGFVIRSDGYILTNNHVVADAVDGGTITATFNNGSSARATIVGRDTSYDLAVVKVDRSKLPTATLGNSDNVVVGDPVVAIGSPLGLSGTVTLGIVSALNRPVTAGDTQGDTSYISAIQTDAAINPGNSGGPLVNSAGQVIGVNSAIATLGQSGQSGSIGLGFAIPINQARRVATQLIRSGKAEYPIIGVSLDISYTGNGAKIATNEINGHPPVTPGGPADQAGLSAGDVITAVDGEPVSDAESLIADIRARAPGDVVTLTVTRPDGSTQDFTVTLGSSLG